MLIVKLLLFGLLLISLSSSKVVRFPGGIKQLKVHKDSVYFSSSSSLYRISKDTFESYKRVSCNLTNHAIFRMNEYNDYLPSVCIPSSNGGQCYEIVDGQRCAKPNDARKVYKIFSEQTAFCFFPRLTFVATSPSNANPRFLLESHKTGTNYSILQKGGTGYLYSMIAMLRWKDGILLISNMTKWGTTHLSISSVFPRAMPFLLDFKERLVTTSACGKGVKTVLLSDVNGTLGSALTDMLIFFIGSKGTLCVINYSLSRSSSKTAYFKKKFYVENFKVTRRRPLASIHASLIALQVNLKDNNEKIDSRNIRSGIYKCHAWNSTECFLLLGTSNGVIQKFVPVSNVKNVGWKLVYKTKLLRPQYDVIIKDSDQDFIYGILENGSATEGFKIGLHHCHHHKSCGSCFTGDPYCVWCPFLSRCQGPSKTPCGSQVKSPEACPVITSVVPRKLVAGKSDQMIQLKIGKFLGNIPNTFSAKCHWYGIPGVSTNITTSGHAFNQSIECKVPSNRFEKSDLVVPVNVSASSLSNQVVNNNVSVEFYNCRHFRSCSKCRAPHRYGNFMFSCSWSQRKCQANVIESEKCPALDKKIVIPFNMVSNVSVHGQNLPVSTKVSYLCRIFGRNYTLDIKSSTFAVCLHVDVTNAPINGFLTKLPMDITARDGLTTINMKDGGPTYGYIYNCSQLRNCSFCRSYHASGYHCQWSNTTETCETLMGGVQSREICADPLIFKVEPLNGPLDGGTTVKVTGKNFGTSKRELDGNVFVAGVPCSVIETNHNNFYCYTGSTKTISTGSVTVFGFENTTFTFTYKYTSLISYSSRHCFTNLRSNITIEIDNYWIGSDRRIDISPSFNSTSCKPEKDFVLRNESRDGSKIRFSCPYCPENKILKEHKIQARVDGYYSPEELFTVLPFPQVLKQMQSTSIDSGGVNIRFVSDFPNFSIKVSMKIRNTISHCSWISTDVICQAPPKPGKRRRSRSIEPYDIEFLTEPQSNFTKEKRFKISYSPNPAFKKFKKDKPVYSNTNLNIEAALGSNLKAGARLEDYFIRFGKTRFNASKLYSDMVMFDISDFPENLKGHPINIRMHVGKSFSQDLGQVIVESWNELLVIPFVVSGVLIIGGLVLLFWYTRKSKAKLAKEKRRYEEYLDKVTAEAANAARNAFTAMQTSMCEMSIVTGDVNVPFHRFDDFIIKCLIPDHPEGIPHVFDQIPPKAIGQLNYIKEPLIDRFDVELLSSKPFLLALMQTFDTCAKMKERSLMASAISLALIQKMEYFYEIIDASLTEIVKNHVDEKKADRLACLFRGSDFLVEKLFSNWLTVCLYSHLRNSDTGKHFYRVCYFLDQYIYQAPVDAITDRAVNVLNEELLFTEELEYKRISINASLEDNTNYQFDDPLPQIDPSRTVSLQILSEDTITQVKEKILKAVYLTEPYSRRLTSDEVELVWKRTSTTSTASDSHDTNDGGKGNTYHIKFDQYANSVDPKTNQLRTIGYFNAKDALENAHFVLMVKGLQNPLISGSVASIATMNEQTSLLSDEERPIWHLSKPAVQTETKISKKDFLLPYILKTKQVMDPLVNNLFRSIFHVDEVNAPPPQFVWHLFNILERVVRLVPQNRSCDPNSMLHIWKSNTFILRVWVNILKNPQFLFDINNHPLLSYSLSTIAQALMDTCSLVSKECFTAMPINKVIYAKDVKENRRWVTDFYLKISSNHSDSSQQDVSIMLQEISRDNQIDRDILFKARRCLFFYAQHFMPQLLEKVNSSTLITDEKERNVMKSSIESILRHNETVSEV